MPSNVEDIPEIISEAVSIAHKGRPGPVWIDLPLDLQWGGIEMLNTKNIHWN